MENGSFLDLKNALPDIKEDFDVKTIPHHILKSNSIDTLLSQNEDLMARLRVLIRRLTHIEDENKNLRDENERISVLKSSFSDQLSIWEEKEKVWKNKISKTEADLFSFQNRFPDLIENEEKLERYKKYHEKVKTQIKPYIKNLKEFVNNLQEQIVQINKELDQKEAALYDLRNSLNNQAEHYLSRIASYESDQKKLTASFENELQARHEEIVSLNEALATAEEIRAKYEDLLVKNDELKNEVIVLNRSKEELSAQNEAHVQATKNENSQLRQTLAEKSINNEDLTKKNELLTQNLHSAEQKLADAIEQLTHIRYLWATQSEEQEKTKVVLASLERLNAELTKKLQTQRYSSNVID